MSDVAGEGQQAGSESEAPPATPVESLTIPEALELAVSLHQKGYLDAASELYLRLLEAVPDHVDALHFLGVCRRQQGRMDEAVELVLRAVAGDPTHVDARNSLGNLWLERGQLDEARAAYEQVVAERPDFAAAHSNLGIIRQRQEELVGAEASFRRALAIDPNYGPALHHLGSLLWDADQVNVEQMNEALSCFQQALKVMPYDAATYRRLGAILTALGRPAEAAGIYERWLVLDPKNTIAPHLLAACLGGDIPARASDAFVEGTFDSFAGSFDTVLARLEYRAPTLVGEAVAAALGAPKGTLDILDAGAGTGLCGPLLRGFARRMVGIDLSKGMLDKAHERGCYDALEAAELTAYMRANPGAYDVIVSADTLVYFGDLTEALAAAASALRPGGHLVFTVEHASEEGGASTGPGEGGARDTPAGFVLNSHGRYAHREDYVRRELAAAGLTLVTIGRAVLRKENRKPVAGLVVTAVLRGPN